MTITSITEEDKKAFNTIVHHPLQSYEWGVFRKKTGVAVVQKGFLEEKKLIEAFQLTIHKIPHTPWTIGYLPKGIVPTKELLEELKKIGKEKKCVFIQLEPNIIRSMNQEVGIKGDISLFDSLIHDSRFMIQPSARPLFTKYTYMLDLTKSEDELLKNMHPKTRYNIKIAQKHNVEIVEDNSDKAFETYLSLTKETTTRQKFYAHTEKYHRLMWETLGIKNQESRIKKETHNSYFMLHDSNKLTAHLFLAKYQPPSETTPIILASWVLFVFKDTLYYPYGASTTTYREVMASNLMMWEVIKFGKKLGLKKFDMWGALSDTPDTKDPWYGFHRFKQGYGATHTEFIGSFDLVINPTLYRGYKLMDKVRWALLRLKK